MNKFSVRRVSRMLLLPASLALFASSAAADVPALGPEADGETAESQWTLPVVGPPTPGAPSGTPEGGYADPDRRRMDEERRKNVLDQLCRKFKLNKDFSLGSGNWPVATIGFKRSMESDIDGGLALIDEEELKASWSLPWSRELGEGGASAGIWAGGTVAGRSIVVRRLGTFNTCAEVDRLIDVTDIKLALPFTAKRIMEMDRGELWRIPLTLNVGYGGSLSNVAEAASLSFGLSKSKNGATSMTLWRLSEKQARFRFRIDYVDVRSGSLGVVATIPAVEFAATGGNILAQFVDKSIAREFHRYTSAYFSFNQAKSNGKRLVLEFVIDPTDPAQAEAMAEALKGNVRALLSLAKRMATSLTTDDETRAAYAGLQNDLAQKLGEPTYAALSEYRGRNRSFPINVPFLINRTVTESFGSDKIVQYTGEGGEFQFHNAARTPNVEYFNMPYMGPLVKDLEHRNIDVVTYAPAGKPTEKPFAVYIHNQAFLRLPASTVRRGIEDANAVLRLAGAARRGASDKTMEIPVPQHPPIPEGTQESSNQKGWVSLTMVINQEAVAAALAASKDELLKAFAVGTPDDDRPMAEWLIKNGRLHRGRLVYDESQAARDLAFPDGGGHESWLAGMSRKAAGMVQDLAEASSAPTNEERAAKLAKAFSHKSRSGMSHADLFRVLIQFIDPLDIRGDFVAASEATTKKSPDIKARYVLTKGRAENVRLGEAGATRGRFADGSVMTD